MSEGRDCKECGAIGTYIFLTQKDSWEGCECTECGYTMSSFIICPKCKGDQRIGTPACGCGSCRKCGHRVACQTTPGIDLHSEAVIIHDMPLQSTVEHTWVNWPKDYAPYICLCGEEFETHEAILYHTSKENPPIELEELGRAGVGIERAAHKETLARLKKITDGLASILDAKKLHHGLGCVPVEGMDHVFCECGIRELELLRKENGNG